MEDHPYTNGPARLGTFATRSPFRPNPIAVSVVQVLRLAQPSGVVEIGWIDAEHGSALLDLKPYQPEPGPRRAAPAPCLVRQLAGLPAGPG